MRCFVHTKQFAIFRILFLVTIMTKVYIIMVAITHK